MFFTGLEYSKLAAKAEAAAALAAAKGGSPHITAADLAQSHITTNPDGSTVDVDDNTLLTVLDKEHIIANLRNRFNRDCIYTFTASVLLAVNPYKQVADLYSSEMQMLYTNKSLHSLPPHPYALADTAYRYFQGDSKSQVLVVSGESGSGKTETSKVILSFLANHKERRKAHSQGEELSQGAAVGDEKSRVHERVISATPIMEAFGNASTIRNKNSSRFGKYHRLLYDQTGKLCGAEIKPLLLEASRVTGTTEHERNFHIFYLLLAGLSEEDLYHKYKLSKRGDLYPLIANGVKQDAFRLSEDAVKCEELLDAFKTVGFSEKEMEEIFATVAGLLVLSRVEFVEQEGEEHKDEEGNSAKLVDVADDAVLDDAALLLGFDRVQLHRVLLNKTVKISKRNSTYSVPRSLAQTETARATLIRTLYKRLFDRIVTRINQLVAVGGGTSGNGAAGIGDDLHIGVLDIFGFENLETNSFPQLCINLTNERLQQFFIRKVLEAEQKTYQAEGIQSEANDVAKLPLPDSSETLACIKGALELLDDHCIRVSRNMPTDEDKYCAQVHAKFGADRPESKLQIPKFAKAKRVDGGRVAQRAKTTQGFVIKHYAGDVMYTVTGWLDKNNERMSPEMECLLRDAKAAEDNRTSGGALVSTFADAEACSYACEKFKSVRSKFMAELDVTLSMLDKCSVHYIRCFNPNSNQRAADFNEPYVEDQVVQCGTVELVNLMHHGFPNRQPLALIAEKFQCMLPLDFRSLSPRDFATVIMNAFEIPPTQYAVGFTTLFLKADQVRLLEQLKGVGELPSERVLSVVRRQVVMKKLKRCLQVVRVVNWLPKLTKELRRKKLFTLGARLAVTLAYALPKARTWLARARETIRLRREEEERLRLIAEEEARKLAEEQERIRQEEERVRLEAERAEKVRLEEERRKAEVEARLLAEIEAAAELERVRIMKEAEEQVKQEEKAKRVVGVNKWGIVPGPDGEYVSAIEGDDSPHGGIKFTTTTRTVPLLPIGGAAGKENLAKTTTNLNGFGNSLAKLPPVTAMMVNNIALFGIPKLRALLVYDGRRMQMVSGESVSDNIVRSRKSSVGTSLAALVPMQLRGSMATAVAQHPAKLDVFATAEVDEPGAVTIWKAGKGIECRFRIHLGSGSSANPDQSAVIQKICFIAPTEGPSVVPSTSHLLAVLVECNPNAESVTQYLIFVEVGMHSSSRRNSSGDINRLSEGSTSPQLFKVHKVEPIAPSQFVSNLNRKVTFVKPSTSGRIVGIGGKGLLMFYAVGLDSAGAIQVDLLAEQSYFPQLQTTTFLAFTSVILPNPRAAIDPEEYLDEQLIVVTGDGNMLRFPLFLNQATCALDISGCGKFKECMATLSGKRITSLVKGTENSYYSITADGCIDQWVWNDRRPYRDADCSIALVSEHSKAMFSTATMLNGQIICFDASAGKVVIFDPSNPDKINPRLLYQFNSHGVLS